MSPVVRKPVSRVSYQLLILACIYIYDCFCNYSLYYLGNKQQWCWSESANAHADQCSCCLHINNVGLLKKWFIWRSGVFADLRTVKQRGLPSIDYVFFFYFFFCLDYFAHIETSQSIGGAKTGVPREKPPDTLASRTWIVPHVTRVEVYVFWQAGF